MLNHQDVHYTKRLSNENVGLHEHPLPSVICFWQLQGLASVVPWNGRSARTVRRSLAEYRPGGLAALAYAPGPENGR